MKERSERLKDQECHFINRPNIDFQTFRISSYVKNKRKKLSAEMVVYIYFFLFFFEKELWELKKLKEVQCGCSIEGTRKTLMMSLKK